MSAAQIEKLKAGDLEEVQTFLGALLRHTKVPGIAVAIAAHGTAIDAAAGVSRLESDLPMTRETHFDLGGINQFLIALLVQELATRELVDVGRAVSHYLPELAGRNGDGITVGHLLSQTDGCQRDNLCDPDVKMDYSFARFSDSFNERPMQFSPGTVFDQSHSSTALLATLVERITGRGAHELVRAHILEPLEIKAVPRRQTWAPHLSGRYTLNAQTGKIQTHGREDCCDYWSHTLGAPWIKMRDLARIGSAIVDGAMFSPPTLHRLMSPAVGLPGQFSGPQAEQCFFSFGSGCARFPTGAYGARSTSQGQCSALRFDMDTGIVVAVALNRDEPYVRDFVVNKLINSLLPRDAPDIPELCPAPHSDFVLEELAGLYEGAPNDRFAATFEDGRLALRRGHSAVEDHDTERVLFAVERENGGVTMRPCDSPRLSAGFFRSPDNAEVCLMVGANVYKRDANAQRI